MGQTFVYATNIQLWLLLDAWNSPKRMNNGTHGHVSNWRENNENQFVCFELKSIDPHFRKFDGKTNKKSLRTDCKQVQNYSKDRKKKNWFSCMTHDTWYTYGVTLKQLTDPQRRTILLSTRSSEIWMLYFRSEVRSDWPLPRIRSVVRCARNVSSIFLRHIILSGVRDKGEKKHFLLIQLDRLEISDGSTKVNMIFHFWDYCCCHCRNNDEGIFNRRTTMKSKSMSTTTNNAWKFFFAFHLITITIIIIKDAKYRYNQEMALSLWAMSDECYECVVCRTVSRNMNKNTFSSRRLIGAFSLHAFFFLPLLISNLTNEFSQFQWNLTDDYQFNAHLIHNFNNKTNKQWLLL